MLENLMRPYLLARVLLGLGVLLTLSYGASIAVRAIMKRGAGATEEALTLDRRAELMAVIVKVATLCASLGLFATVLAADRAHESIRGAMCAYGVLTSTEHGIASLAMSAVLFLASAAWLGLHRLDLRLARGELVETKLRAVVALAPLALVDLVYVVRFVTELNFDVVASCCSTAADSGGSVFATHGMGSSYAMLGATVLGLTTGAALLVFALRRRAILMRLVAAILIGVGVALSVPTIVDVVAPHVYGSPTHRCPFCLLHAEASYVGYPLLCALLVAAAGAMSTLVGAAYGRRFPEASAMGASADGKRTIVAALAIVVLVVLPLVQYAVTSGTLLTL